MIEKFIDWKPNKVSSKLLMEIHNVLETYREQGYTLTLRQLYYQLVSRDVLPAAWADKITGSTNNTSSYMKVGHIVSKGRLAGLIDWQMIEDRNRKISQNSHWEGPKDILQTVAESFCMDKWGDQTFYVVVMCEKDAVSNIIEPVCKRWDVPFIANRGYSSQSAVYRLYQKMEEKIQEGKQICCIYVGDFDPSGLDMDRDITERMNLFFQDVEVFRDIIETFPLHRIALTMDQINEFNPPENPAKSTDSRYAKYASEYGQSSWELDALEPAVLEDIVTEAIKRFVNIDIFQIICEEEEKIKEEIRELANNWGE